MVRGPDFEHSLVKPQADTKDEMFTDILALIAASLWAFESNLLVAIYGPAKTIVSRMSAHSFGF